ncbi:3-hydroxyacyl-[acyl-carrier-protein] dehydratase [Algoriphagus sp. 4150]|uniref:3-hydroxyacyl-ACP dehydratase FabZ family protein n=1 Tax=Algoriphagus sp. 4150 TaxID=2817756 RepID=UPI002860A35F|nr:beta-hydroxyacyl-ACP dehydratase [Algoriphagus sp. 4150]MDR7132562.1 3-hydroxyacyl-[acyl-carrier-protein] dehydratase [Algoriphagus sp. 4150]
MKAENVNIHDLLPHRDPFLFVENMLSVNSEEIIGTKTFNEKDQWLKGSFPDAGIVPGMILVESMAQCGGAGIKLLGLAEGFFALTTIEHVRFFAPAEFDRKIKYIIQNLRISRGIIKQSGVAYMDELKLFEAAWMSVKAV